MKADWNEKEEKVLAELDELKYTGGWHKIRIEVLKKYAAEVSRDECIKYLEFVVDYCDEIIYGDQAESYYEAFKEQEEQC